MKQQIYYHLKKAYIITRHRFKHWANRRHISFCLSRNFLKRNIRTVMPVSFFCVTLIAIAVSMHLSGLTLAYDITYCDGVTVTVEDKSAFNSAKQIIGNASATEDVVGLIKEPVITRTLAIRSQISDVNEVADVILDNTDEIVTATVLRVNGEYVTCVAGETSLDKYIEDALNRYEISGATSSSSQFVDTVTTEVAYYLASQVNSIEGAIETINSLPVKTIATVQYNYNTSYSTVVIKDNTQRVGYSAVKTRGKNGVTQSVDSVTYLNGVEQSRDRLQATVVSNPINEVVVIGTAPISVGSRFTFPLTNYILVSAWWGDGRNHKAIDLAANYGTPIRAALPGTVTISKYDSGYGYHVKIDHGNGVQTLYAHASKLYVKTGEYVSAGQTIALVGSTGNSTGNHLHFEVIINGVRVDPAPYIGLY